jgi:peptidoglycan/LPS O-acetylase OafA/YrhL
MKLINFKSGVRNQTNYLYELESLRGIAISLVVLFHIWGIAIGGGAFQHSIFMSFISSGSSGVTLFFVLSGFLLSMPFFQGIKSGDHPPIRQYYFSRLLRIIPLYYIAVIASMVATGKYTEAIPALWFSYVGFSVFPYSVVWWTLSTEVQFYLLLPLFMYLLRSSKGRAAFAAILLAWSYFYYQHSIAQPGNILQPYYSLTTLSIFARLPAFILGMAGCYLFLTYRERLQIWNKLITVRLGGLGIIIALTLLLGLVLQHSSSMGGLKAERIWHIKHIYEALCWLGILLATLLTNPIGKGLLINTFNGVIGKLSYSLYLIHVPVLFFVIHPLRTEMGAEAFIDSPYLYLLSITGCILSVLASYVSYRYIELPFLKLKELIPQPQTNINADSLCKDLEKSESK